MRMSAVLLLLAVSVAAEAGPRLYVFDCGELRLDGVAAFGLAADETPVRELFVPCYLVRQADGLLFWDGGLPLGVAAADGPVAMDDGSMVYRRSIIDQLADLGIAPEDISYAAYSHLHFDHVGAANALAGAGTVLMQVKEWEAAWDGEGFVETGLIEALRHAELTFIDGDHDVFGDGSVEIIYAPGHTAGHQALLVNLDETGPVLLSGDLYHFRESRALRRVPEFNVDAAATLESMDRVEALLEARGATLWIGHDKAFADTLRKAPEYYE